MLGLLLYLVIVGLIFSVLWWGLTQIQLPPPFAMVARVILVVVIVIFLVTILAQMGGINLSGPPSLRLTN